ncbi:hypothetical protein D9M71_365440 [compost metagenome]
MLAAVFGQALQPRCLHVHGVPGDIQLGGQAGAGAHDLFALLAGADAGQQRFAVGPYRLHGRVAAVGLHLVVNAVGGAAQGQLAKREQVALAEEVRRGPLGLRRQVDLAGLQALQQFVGRKVDHHHLVGLIEQPVGHRFPDANAGDAADDVVQAFQVLHVHRRPDVDAGVQQLLDVLPALGMARAGCVAVGQFVDQHQGARVAGGEGQRGVEVELLQGALAVGYLLKRQTRQLARHGFGIGATVRLDQPDDQRGALGLRGLRGRQHRVGLADAGRGAEEHLQPSAARVGLFLLHALQQGVRVGAVVIARVHHCCSSSVRFSSSTLTRGSPRKPSQRPSVCRSTSVRTSSGDRPRALATRASW